MEKNTGQAVMRLVLKCLFVLMAIIGLSACSLLQGESVDGNWTSHTAAKAMYDEFLKSAGEDMFANSDHSIEEIVTKSEVNLDIKDDKASLGIELYIDKEAFFQALKDEQLAAVKKELEKQGYNYDTLEPALKAEVDANLQSDDDIRKWVDEAIEGMSKEMGGAYSAEKGLVHTDVFKADVQRGSETFKITKIGSSFGKDIVKKGESYQYTYKDGKLTLEGEKNEDDMVFEKKK